MKKIVKIIGIACVAAALVSCGDDSKYQIEKEKIAEQVEGMKSYTMQYTMTYGSQSMTVYGYYTENCYEIKSGDASIIYSHEGDNYYTYTQESKDADWVKSSISSYQYSYNEGEYTEDIGSLDEYIDNLEYNKKTKKYEYNKEEDGITGKISFGFEDSIIKTISFDVYNEQYRMYFGFTNINSTTITLPNVEDSSSTTTTTTTTTAQ